MNNLNQEIDELVDYFNEINLRFEQVKQTRQYKCWLKTPLSPGLISESKTFRLILWPGTEKERIFLQSVTKHIKINKSIPKRLKELIKLDRLEQMLSNVEL